MKRIMFSFFLVTILLVPLFSLSEKTVNLVGIDKDGKNINITVIIPVYEYKEFRGPSDKGTTDRGKYLECINWVHDTSKYLTGLNTGMVFADFETKLSYESNIFTIEPLKDVWDKIGNYSLATGSAITLLAYLIPDSWGIDKDVLQTISISAGAIGKTVFSLISSDNQKNYNEKFNKIISRISVARQSVDDLKIRMDLYKRIRAKISEIISKDGILNLIDSNCYISMGTELKPDELENKRTASIKYLVDNKEKYLALADELRQLGDLVFSLYNEILVKCTYYETIYTNYGLKDEKNPFTELKNKIDIEKKSFVDSNEISFFSSLYGYKILF
jgi:hypothetical protein